MGTRRDSGVGGRQVGGSQGGGGRWAGSGEGRGTWGEPRAEEPRRPFLVHLKLSQGFTPPSPVRSVRTTLSQELLGDNIPQRGVYMSRGDRHKGTRRRWGALCVSPPLCLSITLHVWTSWGSRQGGTGRGAVLGSWYCSVDECVGPQVPGQAAQPASWVLGPVETRKNSRLLAVAQTPVAAESRRHSLC